MTTNNRRTAEEGELNENQWNGEVFIVYGNSLKRKYCNDVVLITVYSLNYVYQLSTSIIFNRTKAFFFKYCYWSIRISFAHLLSLQSGNDMALQQSYFLKVSLHLSSFLLKVVYKSNPSQICMLISMQIFFHSWTYTILTNKNTKGFCLEMRCSRFSNRFIMFNTVYYWLMISFKNWKYLNEQVNNLLMFETCGSSLTMKFQWGIRDNFHEYLVIFFIWYYFSL